MDIYLISIINLIILNLIIIIIKILLHNLYKYKLHIEQLLSLFYFIILYPSESSCITFIKIFYAKYSNIPILHSLFHFPSNWHNWSKNTNRLSIYIYKKKNSRKNFYILTLSYKECINCKDGVKNCCYLCHVYYRDPVIHI